MPNVLFPNGQPSFPATQHLIYETTFKQRFRDKSILPLITNRSFEGRFKKKGTTINVPILPIIETHKVKAGDIVKYQSPKGAMETFTINREREFAFKIEDEDKLFSAMDLEGPVIAEANRQMAEDIEQEFLADIIYKTHFCNQGNHAGIRSGSYNLGSVDNPLSLFKTEKACSDATGVTDKAVAPDFLVACINTLNEMPGGLDTKPFIIIPTAVANILQTSELKMANWMGDAQSVMRKSVRYLGELNGATIISNNQLPMWIDEDSGKPLFTIFFGDSSAVSFAEEVKMSQTLEDINVWGKHHRTKIIYDWFVKYSERIGTGVVSIG